MKLKLNPDYAKRHLFVTVLMLGLSCWFGYDGFVRYPAMSGGELYRSIEGSDAPENYPLEDFKRQKTQTQYGFTVLTLAAALIVGLRLLKSAKFDFEYDEQGCTFNGHRYENGDIVGVDSTRWRSKGIVGLKFANGTKAVLDSWHHLGVRECVQVLPALGGLIKTPEK